MLPSELVSGASEVRRLQKRGWVVSWSTPGAARSLGHSTKIPPFRDDMGWIPNNTNKRPKEMFLFHVSWEIKHPWIWKCLNESLYFNSSNKQKYFAGWWLNQPIRKKCSSKWVHLPRFSGWKFQKICFLNHHPVFRFRYPTWDWQPPLGLPSIQPTTSLNSTPLRKVGCKCWKGLVPWPISPRLGLGRNSMKPGKFMENSHKIHGNYDAKPAFL